MTIRPRKPALPHLKKMLGRAAAGQIAAREAAGADRRRSPRRIRLLAIAAVATAIAAAAVSAGALNRIPVAPSLGPEESGVGTLEPPNGHEFRGEGDPCIKSDPSGYSDAELEEPEWCFHRPAKLNRSQLGLPMAKNSTDVIVVDPVDANYQPVPGLEIEDLGTAQSCSAGSDSVGNAYRCFGGNLVADPCWRDDADPSTTAVLCQTRPWEKRVGRFVLGQRGLEPFDRPSPQAGAYQPWGVELSTGERCVALQGAHSPFPSPTNGRRVIDYDCENRAGRRDGRFLLRGIHRTHAPWRIDSASYDAKGYKLGPRLGIVTAWYAGQE